MITSKIPLQIIKSQLKNSMVRPLPTSTESQLMIGYHSCSSATIHHQELMVGCLTHTLLSWFIDGGSLSTPWHIPLVCSSSWDTITSGLKSRERCNWNYKTYNSTNISNNKHHKWRTIFAGGAPSLSCSTAFLGIDLTLGHALFKASSRLWSAGCCSLGLIGGSTQ